MSRPMNDSGISTIIGALLILALLISAAAVVKVSYIPDVKKQLEAEHMQHVIDDFISFKSLLDTLQATSTTGRGYTAAARIEMGGGSIPGIDPSTSAGTLTIDPSYGSFTITAYYLNGTRVTTRNASPIGRLVYQSNNGHFVDQQISYESGMILLSQDSGNVTLSTPSITVTRDPGNPGRSIVVINPLRLNGSPQSFSSSGRSSLKTSLLPENNVYMAGNVTNVTLTIVSDNAPHWYSYLSSTLANSGLAAGANYNLTMPGPQTVTVLIKGSGIDDLGFYMIDSAFTTSFDSAAAQVTPLPPTPTPTPSPTPTPTPSPTPTPTPTPTPMPVLEFGSPAYAGMEGSTIPVTITRTGSSSGQASVDYTIAGGNATLGVNYTVSPLPGTITFDSGETSKTISVTAIDNVVYGGDKTVVFQLSGPVNATLGAQTLTTVTIQENEPAPSYVQFASAAYTGAEGGGTVQIVVTRTGNTAVSSRVEFYRSAGNATVNSDYSTSPAPGILTFNASETTRTITVTIVDDSTRENDEVATFSLRNPVNCSVGTPGSTTLTILDNELDHFTITASNPWVPGSSDNITVTAYTRSNRVLTSYRGGVYFTSSYSSDTFDYYNAGNAYTFTALDNGTHVFQGNAHLAYRNGLHTVTVRSTPPGSITASVSIQY